MNQEFQIPSVFECSPDQENLAKALVKFNDSMGKVAKTSANPFFKSKYAALPDILDAIKQPLIESGLSLSHAPAGDNCIVSILRHTSGEWQRSVFYMKSVKDTPQDRGSVITYMVRYAVGAILNLSIDIDDDGNKGTFGKTSNTPAAPPIPVLKQMTKGIADAMLKYVEDGNLEAVEAKLPLYKDGKYKQSVVDAVVDVKTAKK